MIGKLKPSFGLIIIFALCVPALAQQIPPNATVYDILPLFGLPSGLLPSSVQSYTFNPDDGRFIVVLPKPCYIKFDYLVYYEDTISGVLRYGSITELKGIKLRRFFVLFVVDEIQVDLPPSDSIYFQVGVIEEKLDVNQFRSVRSCDNAFESGCGSVLGGGEATKMPEPINGAVDVK